MRQLGRRLVRRNAPPLILLCGASELDIHARDSTVAQVTMLYKDVSDAGHAHDLMANCAVAQRRVSMMRPRVCWEWTDVQVVSRMAEGVESRSLLSLKGDTCNGCTCWSYSFETARIQNHRNNVHVPNGPIANVGCLCCSRANIPSAFFVDQANTSVEEWL